MKTFDTKSLALFGRLPALSLAELESLYGAEHLLPVEGGALLDLDTENIKVSRLGGTIKLCKVLAVIDTDRWQQVEKFLIDNIPKHLHYLPEGKFTLGLSLYNFDMPIDHLNRSLMAIKKNVKKTGRPVRVVPNRALELNSAQVLHNRLTTKGAWELVLLRDGKRTILAQTIFVQDIEAYGARDQARPKRDARVGMLPPKLAQTIVNLAAPSQNRLTVLDPFCGTGVILQEALLMGFDAIGTDLQPRMIEYTKVNLDWLKQRHEELSGEVSLAVGDATNYEWPPFDGLASEVYLGRPLAKIPSTAELDDIVDDVNTIIKKFLVNLARQLKSGQRLCIAVPTWQTGPGQFRRLPLVDQINILGYNYLDLKLVRHGELVYFRQGQAVARQLLALTKA